MRRRERMWRRAYGEYSGYVGGQKEGHWGLGTWCGLSHLGLTGLGGWVTTGHAALWATEARGTHSAFMHLLSEARLPGVLNQRLSHTDYLTLAVGGCIYPFCSVRTNRYSTILRVCCRGGKGKTASLRWRCVAAMKHDPLHHVTAAHTCCMSSDPLFCASELIKLVVSTVC